MNMESLLIQNGGGANIRKIPRLQIQTFRQEILDAVARGLRLAGLFGQRQDAKSAEIFAILADDEENALALLSAEISGRYPALTPECPQAHLFEREIYEQTGIIPESHPWLKPVRYPALAEGAAPIPRETEFFSARGVELHEVAVGPVHAGIIEPGHFRFQCRGETVLHLEIQLGYQHRGAEKFLETAPSPRAMAVAESIAGDTAIGHALAYCETIESLSGCRVSPRAQGIRGIALEIERVANHVGDLGALCTDIGFLPAAAYFGRLRGEFLNLLMDLSGNRYGRSLLRPGGVNFDLPPEMATDFTARLDRAERDFKNIADLMFSSGSVQARFEGTGTVSAQAGWDLGLVGPAARACGIERDVRSDHPHGIYQFAYIPVSTAPSGDVYGRAVVRRSETERSIHFLKTQIQNLPDGARDLKISCGPLHRGRLSVCLVESWRGEILHAAATDEHGRIKKYKVKDPSFHNWTALALALRETPISDFPLCNKSFNLSYAGHDL